MADEKKPKEPKEPKARKKPVEPVADAGILAETAKAIGSAAGKIAALAGVSEPVQEKPQTKSSKLPKLQKKDKSRLPRRQKKAQQKAAANQANPSAR